MGWRWRTERGAMGGVHILPSCISTAVEPKSEREALPSDDRYTSCIKDSLNVSSRLHFSRLDHDGKQLARAAERPVVPVFATEDVDVSTQSIRR